MDDRRFDARVETAGDDVQLRMQGDLTAGEITSLMGEESALASEVAAEQARWNDLSARLEEIERGLR